MGTIDIFSGVWVPGHIDFGIHKIEVYEARKIKIGQRSATIAWYEISNKTWQRITSRCRPQPGNTLPVADVWCDKAAGCPLITSWCYQQYKKGCVARSTTKVVFSKDFWKRRINGEHQ